MAFCMFSPLLQDVLHRLLWLIGSESGRICGFDGEMLRRAKKLASVFHVLADAEERQVTDQVALDWLLKLSDLVYDADDILDELEIEAELISHPNQVFLPCFPWFNSAQVALRRRFVERVSCLCKKFEMISMERSGCGLRRVLAEWRLERYRGRETSSFPTEAHVYGREEEQEFIVSQVIHNVGGGEALSVHPVVGVGGLGKTTFAQLCFNDPRVEAHFDVRIWNRVLHDFDVKRLTREVIESHSGERCNLEELESLQSLLQEKLAQKRFLLVLDDVLTEDPEAWSKFITPLRCGAIGSSVIVTTRLDTVALITGTRAPLKLKPLSEDDCWSLFRERAFPMGEDVSPNLLIIGHEIVRKCGGLPLVAKVLGSLMRLKHNEREWLFVRDSSIWELPQSEYNTILPVLRLSYTQLAPHVRQCFAFCSVFPKEHRMQKEELICLWMANGFIRSNYKMKMEEIGNEVFEELCSRSFFQDEKKNSDGLVVSCMMHDLMHDLASSVNLKECRHLAESTQLRDVSLRTRHLSVNRAKKSYGVLDSIHKLEPNLRTLMLLNYDREDEPITEVCLKSLRALSLNREVFHKPTNGKLLDTLRNLKHLRYLNFSFSGVKLLPDSLCELGKLQILNLERCTELEMLPKHMRNMTSLRHLKIEGCSKLCEMPVRMGKLICLRTLSFFIVGPGEGLRIKELQELNYLGGVFEIKGLEHVKTLEEAKEVNLGDKENIVSLELVWDNVDSVNETRQRDVLEGLQPHPNLEKLHIRGYKGLTFPSWLDLDVSSSLPNLVDLSISICSRCEHLPSSLRMQPLLRRLVISEVKSMKFFVANNDDDVAIVFPSLETLDIQEMDELEDWFPYVTGGNSISENVIMFPCLKELDVQGCPKLKRLPPSPLSSLETLTFRENCNPTVLGSVQNLPHLSSLKISHFKDTTCFPEESLRNLPFLKSLAIRECGNLQSLPSLVGCSSLQSLEIFKCPSAKISTVEYENLHSLQKLVITENVDMPTLPDGLQHISSTLQSLRISSWSALNSLPIWIRDFTNLEYLYLLNCKNLRSLPDGLQQLTNLRSLDILGCHPELHRRCNKETGEDWPKIKHISQVFDRP